MTGHMTRGVSIGAFVSAAFLFTTPRQFLGPTAFTASGGSKEAEGPRWSSAAPQSSRLVLLWPFPWRNAEVWVSDGPKPPSLPPLIICGTMNSSSPLPGIIPDVQFGLVHGPRLTPGPTKKCCFNDDRTL